METVLHRRRMQELNLKNYEMYLHDELMEMKMNEWPESLFEFVQERCKETGMCMEVLIHAVADWIRFPRTLPNSGKEEEGNPYGKIDEETRALAKGELPKTAIKLEDCVYFIPTKKEQP